MLFVFNIVHWCYSYRLQKLVQLLEYSLFEYLLWISMLWKLMSETNSKTLNRTSLPFHTNLQVATDTHTNQTCCRTLNLPTKTDANWGWRQKGNTPFFFSFPSSCQLQVRNAQQMRKNVVQFSDCYTICMWTIDSWCDVRNPKCLRQTSLWSYISYLFQVQYMFMLSSPCFTEILKHSFTEG